MNFDILLWWKVNQVEFPILSWLARDILSMQVSTVASESTFNAGGRVVDPFRGRLNPEIVQALICTKNWIGASKGSDIASVVKDMDIPSLEELLQLWCT
uniref:HAT C-terminal dimerisation domain-containing protein n=1 Tax=Triticum urartu TaxID=4572 RepID=A0A8R7V7P4_TRIUA